jgi:5-methylcytosine-specific restriction protein A
VSGGWADSDRRSRLPENWGQLVKAVKIRDGNQCRKKLPSGKRCPRPGTEVDHIVPNDDHGLKNLRLLCAHHHARKTAFEAWQGKRRKKPPGRAPEPHPGLRRR